MSESVSKCENKTHSVSFGEMLHVLQVLGQRGDETLVGQTDEVGFRASLHHFIELCGHRKHFQVQSETQITEHHSL